MRGYKIATAVHRKVLVVLDIPDDAKRTTPEMRYSKVPLGSFNELNEWFNAVQKYKAHPDAHTLFLDFRGLMSRLEMRLHVYSDYIHVRKCRAAKAKVVKIIGLTDGKHYDSAVSDFDTFTTYQTGETVIPDAYTDDYLNICAHGIHYFETPEIAMLYYAKDLSPTEASAFLNHAEELLEKLRKEGDI